MLLSSTEVSEPLRDAPRRPRWSIRRDQLPTNPALLAAGGAETVAVEMVGYVAQRLNYDTEECIQKALEDGEIEMYYPSRDKTRGHDTYRLTAKGRRTSDSHLREVFRESAEVARRECEGHCPERGRAEPAGGTANSGKPPPPEGGIAFRLPAAWLITVATAASCRSPLPGRGMFALAPARPTRPACRPARITAGGPRARARRGPREIRRSPGRLPHQASPADPLPTQARRARQVLPRRVAARGASRRPKPQAGWRTAEGE